MSAALIAGVLCIVGTVGIMGCSSISSITTEDLGGCLVLHVSLLSSEMNSEGPGCCPG